MFVNFVTVLGAIRLMHDFNTGLEEVCISLLIQVADEKFLSGILIFPKRIMSKLCQHFKNKYIISSIGLIFI
jgi:hypothetical protein